MTRLLLVWLLVPTTTTTTTAFVLTTPSSSQLQSIRKQQQSPLCANENDDDDYDDDYDDWYADFDPTAFVDDRPPMSETGGGGYQGGGRRGGGYRGGGGYQRGGGGRYSRDTDHDDSAVNEDAVHNLLDQRADARRQRRYDDADAIRDELLNSFGVRVDDKSRSWRTGCSASGSGSRFGGGGGGGGGRGGRPQHQQQRRQRQRQRRPDRDFGPTGHDYNQAGGPIATDCPFTETEIDARIAQRLQCKLNRQFDQADEIQATLEEAGVKVHDGWKQWRADGEGWENDTGPMRGGGGGAYQLSRHSEPVEAELQSQIEEMVANRAVAKRNRDYSTADEIRDELRTVHNVFLDDRKKEWSVGGDFGSRDEFDDRRYEQRGWRQSTRSAAPDPAAIVSIEALLADRTEARRLRNFDTADEIRDRLRQEFGVVVNDRRSEWWIPDQERPRRDDADKGYVIVEDNEDATDTKSSANDVDSSTEPEESDEEWSSSINEGLQPLGNSAANPESSMTDQESSSNDSLMSTADLERMFDEDDGTFVSKDDQSEEDLAALTVPQLKERLRDAGLPVSGRKSELIERLSTDSDGE